MVATSSTTVSTVELDLVGRPFQLVGRLRELLDHAGDIALEKIGDVLAALPLARRHRIEIGRDCQSHVQEHRPQQRLDRGPGPPGPASVGDEGAHEMRRDFRVAGDIGARFQPDVAVDLPDPVHGIEIAGIEAAL